MKQWNSIFEDREIYLVGLLLKECKKIVRGLPDKRIKKWRKLVRVNQIYKLIEVNRKLMSKKSQSRMVNIFNNQYQICGKWLIMAH